MKEFKTVGDYVFRRPANEDEALILDRVVAVARAWKDGQLDLAGIDAQCRGYERDLAFRISEPGADREILRELFEWIVPEREGSQGPRFEITDYGTKELQKETPLNRSAGETDVPPLYLTQQELGNLGYKQMKNYEGKWVLVAPLCMMHGEWVYPPVNLPPGDERRAVEAALNLRYKDYRDEKKRKGGRTRG